MRYIIDRLKCPCAFLDVKTDAINLQVATKHLAKIREAVEEARFCDLHRLTRKGGQTTLRDALTITPRKVRAK
jgi:hypothetical protein